MFCVKCGNKIEENQTFCTNCGAPATGEIVKEEVVEEPKKEVVEDVQVESKVEPVITSSEATTKPKNTGAKVGVIIFLVVLVLGIIAWAVLTRMVDSYLYGNQKESPDNQEVSSPSESTNPSPSAKSKNTKKVSYAGYDFRYATDYTVKDMNETGLVFQNNDLAFSVKVDYTHSFRDYKSYLQDIYGKEQTEKSIEKLDNKTYIFFYQQDTSTGEVAYVYATETDDHHVFVGLFALKSHGFPSLTDVQAIEDVLGTATVDSSFKKKDDYDSGADGSYFPEFSYDFFESESF